MDIIIVTRAMRVRTPHRELKWEIPKETFFELTEEQKEIKQRAMLPTSQTVSPGLAILRHGTEEQKDKYVRGLARGERGPPESHGRKILGQFLDQIKGG